MICPERRHLLIEYRDRADQYARCVGEVVDKILMAVGSDLTLLESRCREAWNQAEQARLALRRHEVNHFCDRPDFGLSEGVSSAGAPHQQ